MPSEVAAPHTSTTGLPLLRLRASRIAAETPDIRLVEFVDPSGADLPPRYAPWAPFKTLELRRGEPTPGLDVDECLDDLAAYGVHVTDAHARITEQALR